ncbi:MAG: hypothetical protein BHW08_09680 [Clostridium sp. CAG:12237_41]|nr:MAG: hypothetical protein BHW08_09680 [Clostridium sp. CAG:12237_41]
MDRFIKRFGRVITFLLAAVLVFNVSGNVNAAKKKKTVVIYFSATGTTKSVAGKIKKATKGSLIEIKASQPYTDDDLNWSDSNSRVTKEHKSASSPAKSKVRPKISNIKQIQKAVKSADIVYIGYPIWWGEAPHIVYTLVESTSLKGKTVVPFSTSLSSGMGSSGSHLKTKAIISKKTKWNKGKGFYGRSSQKTVDKWVKTIK